MMLFLLTALKQRLATDLAALSLLGQGAEGAIIQPVRVHLGDLPLSKAGTAGQPFPFVLLLPLSGHQREGEAEIRVALTCGVYNPEDGDAEGAEMDLAALLAAVGQSLTPCVNAPLEARYKLIPDARGRLLPWQKNSVQARPYRQATLMTLWRMKGLELFRSFHT